MKTLNVDGSPESVDGKLVRLLSTGITADGPISFIREVAYHHPQMIEEMFSGLEQAEVWIKNHRKRWKHLSRYERG